MFRITFCVLILTSFFIADSAEAQLFRRLFGGPQIARPLQAQPTNNAIQFQRQQQARYFYEFERARNSAELFELQARQQRQGYGPQEVAWEQYARQQQQRLGQQPRFAQRQFAQQQQAQLQQSGQQQFALVTVQSQYGPQTIRVRIPNVNQRFAGNIQQVQSPQQFQYNNPNQFAGQRPSIVAQSPTQGAGNSSPTLQQPNVVAPAAPLSSVAGSLESPAVGFNPPLSEPTQPKPINDPSVVPASANVVEFNEVEPISLNELAPGEAPTINAPTTDGPGLNPPTIDAPALTPPADITPLESEAKSILKKK